MTKQYNTVQQLAAAFACGELDKTKYTLVLDNDDSYLTYTGPLPDGVDEDSDAAYEWYRQKHNEAMNLFRGNGYGDLLAAFAAAGIPAEWC